ncbi:MAG: hypothetical protein IH951_11695 [Bacteroidetes bacterium]|nr:hypothetical protein [Bacteroidota bacterium]
MQLDMRTLEEPFHWEPPQPDEPWHRDTCGEETEAIGMIGDQVVARIFGKLKKDSTWMKEYSCQQVYQEGDGGKSSHHIRSGVSRLDNAKEYTEDFLFGALRNRLWCTSCGQLANVDNKTNTDELRERQLCFFCDNWLHHTKSPKSPLVAIIEGHFYTINPNEGHPSSCKGFGGRPHHIHWFNEREDRNTSNLWHGGKIPEHLKDLFPDNAEFVKENQS